MPGRFGRLHASLPLRRNASPSWALTESPTTRAYRPRRPRRRGPPVAGPSPERPAPRERPGQRARTATRASGSTTLRSHASRSDMQVNASEVAHHDPYARGPQRTRNPRRTLPDPLLPSVPRLCLPPRPLYLRSSDRFYCSFFMVLMLLSVPSCLPPPRLRPSTLHAWAALPGVCLQVEEGGSSAKRWTPLPRKPRRKAKTGPEAGRRPVDLQGSTARDQHQEVGPRTP